MIWQKKLSFLFLICLFLNFNFFLSSSSFAAMYTYTGSHQLIDDGSGNYRIKFLTSGTFTPANNMVVDAFLVGGGGGGGRIYGSGGGGGYTNTYSNMTLSAGVGYSVIVGAGGVNTVESEAGVRGGTTGFNGGVAYGGYGGTARWNGSAAGGSGGGGAGNTDGIGGGNGGSNGGNGGAGAYVAGGTGQGTTTREFGEATGTLYSRGGGGYNGGTYGSGISGANSGSGGNAGIDGFSGIVVVRFTDSITPTCGVWSPTSSAWKTSGTQTFALSGSTDAGGSGINVSSGSCTTSPTNGSTCTVTISDNAGNTRVCTSPVNNVDATAPTCGTWSPSSSTWRTSGTQTFSLSGSTDSGGSGINVSSGSCTTGSSNGSTCTVTISDNAGNQRVCTSPVNNVDATAPIINSITANQELATASGDSVTLTISGLADTGGAELASLKYSYFVPGSSSWSQTTVANTSSSASFDIPITKEGIYYVKAVVADNASNWSSEVETSIFINRNTFSSPILTSPAPTFAKPLQIKDIAKGSYVSWNGYLFVKLADIGETGPFLAVSPMCEQPSILVSSGILDNTNTIYTGHLPTPGQTTVAIVSSPNSSMHGTCTWSSTTDPTLSSITSYIDTNHCIATINTPTTTTYTVSMTGCLTNPTTSLTVSLAEFEGE